VAEVARDDVEAAYFTLLRARQELDDLRRYDEYLLAESQRLRRTMREAEALATTVEPKLLRPLRHTEQPLTEAQTARLRTIDDERSRLPDRLAAAERFVEECEREHESLKRGR
jgi:hypothetical protein